MLDILKVNTICAECGGKNSIIELDEIDIIDGELIHYCCTECGTKARFVEDLIKN